MNKCFYFLPIMAATVNSFFFSIKQGDISLKANKVSRLNEDDFYRIDLKEQVIFKYYEKYVIESRALSKLSFDEFKILFEQSRITIDEFTNELVRQNEISIYKEGGLRSSSSSSYVLGYDEDEVGTSSVFAKAPIYYAHCYDNLQFGDIIIEADDSNFYHVAIITSTNYSVSGFTDVSSYIQTIEAVIPKVQFGYLDDARICEKNVVVYRYINANNLTNYDKYNMLYFLNAQLGDDYLPHFDSPHYDYWANTWYCGELVWATYKYIGIDLLPNRASSGLIYGTEFIDSPLSTQVSCDVDDNNFLYVVLSEKVGSNWVIYIFNGFPYQLTVTFNTKMCFLNDGLSWNVFDSFTTQISGYDYIGAYVAENFYADSIAAYYNKQVDSTIYKMITVISDINSVYDYAYYYSVV